MDCCFDRTGFPYIESKDLALAVSLLPLTKLQFEVYLADLTPQGDRWYEELLALNPRVSPQRFTSEQRERLFLTGYCRRRPKPTPPGWGTAIGCRPWWNGGPSISGFSPSYLRRLSRHPLPAVGQMLCCVAWRRRRGPKPCWISA